MKKCVLFLNVFWLIALLFGVSSKAVIAGSNLVLNPSTGNYTVEENFSVTVKMNTNGVVIGGIDGKGTYDSTKLELTDLKTAPNLVFNTTKEEGVIGGGGECDITDKSGGKFSFFCYPYENVSANTESGDVVIFNFKAKAIGTALVKFDCVDSLTTDTNIIQADPTADVIVCGENINGSYVIAAGSGVGLTSTPTSSDNSVEKSSTDELPQTGGIGATLGLILFGAVSVASAVFLKFL